MPVACGYGSKEVQGVLRHGDSSSRIDALFAYAGHGVGQQGGRRGPSHCGQQWYAFEFALLNCVKLRQ